MNHLLKCCFTILIAQSIIVPPSVMAQDEGFIYGKVFTIEQEEYTGALRWGKEEVFWTDIFNASKKYNPNLDYLSRKEMDDLRNSRSYPRRIASWFSNAWGWDGRETDEFVHQFACQFGEIKSIDVIRRNRIEIRLQNGRKMELGGSGYNDIGTDIYVLDAEIGKIKLDWDNIERVEFMKTPARLEQKFGEPLYGKVDTDYGAFTGFVQWDHDERVSKDKLDGDTPDGDLSIPFGRIKTIENRGNGVDLVLNSGRELYLRGSNDVNNDNDGIIVTVAGLGRVDIPWRDFEKVEFTQAPKKMKSYDDFKKQNPIEGTVRADEKTWKGKIIYDLDEELELELLHGKEDDMEYIIPFRNIKNITPRNSYRTEVTLKNGEKLVLEDSQDVSGRNSGLLVFDNTKPVYIPWYDVDSIDIN